MSRVSARAKGAGLVAAGLLLLGVATWQMQAAWRVANGNEVEGRVMERDDEAGIVKVRFVGVRETEVLPFALPPERLSKLRRGSRLTLTVVGEGEAYLVGQGVNPILILAPLLLGAALGGVGGVQIVRGSAA